MESKRLRRLQMGTLIALVLSVALVIYLFLVLPLGQPKWSNAMAERRIQSASSVQELQNDLRSAVSSLSTFRHSRNDMLLVCLVAGIVMTGFLAWSWLMMERMKREVLGDRAA